VGRSAPEPVSGFVYAEALELELTPPRSAATSRNGNVMMSRINLDRQGLIQDVCFGPPASRSSRVEHAAGPAMAQRHRPDPVPAAL
jgi:hypothetical protein